MLFSDCRLDTGGIISSRSEVSSSVPSPHRSSRRTMSQERSRFRVFRLVAAEFLAFARRLKNWLRRLGPEDQARGQQDGQDWGHATSSDSGVDALKRDNT